MHYLKTMIARMPLRTCLLALLALGGTFLAADRFREILEERNAEIDRAKRVIIEERQRGAERQAHFFSDIRLLLRLLASSPEADGSSSSACEAPFRKTVAELGWLSSLTVVNAAGQAVCTSFADRTPRSVADRGYFKDAVASRDLVISDYLISRGSGKPIIVAAMPRIVDGAVRTVIVAAIDVTWFGQSATADGGDSLVLDRKGTVFASTAGFGSSWVGRSLRGEPIWAAFAAQEGMIETSALDGKPRLVAYSKLPDTGALLLISRQRSDILRSIDRDAWRFMSKMAATMLVGLLFVWFGGERLVLRPIETLIRGAQRLGSGDLTSRVETEGFAPELRQLGTAFNAMANRLARQDAELREANARLEELVTKDGLTNLANRRGFDQRSEIEALRSIRERRPISLIVLDVDRFKQFNDRYGHVAGDECLRRIAVALSRAAKRPGDFAARLGGEEFAVLLSGCALDDAVDVAERMRRAIMELGIEHSDSREGRVTASFGVADWRPTEGQTVQSLLDAADAALYEAKRAGRNLVVSAGSSVAFASAKILEPATPKGRDGLYESQTLFDS